MIQAVIFDLDGLLIDSEPVWDGVRRAWAEERGVLDWGGADHRACMGVSTQAWAEHMRRRLGLGLPTEAVIERIVGAMRAEYRVAIPWKAGALAAINLARAHFRIGLASGSEKSLIEIVVADPAVAGKFETVVCTDDMPRGKPAPDVYLAAARGLGVAPCDCVCLEDSGAGIAAGHAAGMRVIAIPDPRFPPKPELLALADATLGTLEEVTLDVLSRER